MKIVCTLISENFSERAIELCDVVEIRLDSLKKRSVGKMIESIEKDLIFTCRRESDGGRYRGSEDERLKLLSRYVMYADFMDIEWDVGDEFFEAVRSAGVVVVESYHGKNPGYKHLKDLIEGKRGDFFKIAIQDASIEDIRLILKLHAEYENLIAFLVGEEFRFTRVLSSLVGNPFIYCHAGVSAALGQYSVEEAFRLRNMLFGEFGEGTG